MGGEFGGEGGEEERFEGREEERVAANTLNIFDVDDADRVNDRPIKCRRPFSPALGDYRVRASADDDAGPRAAPDDAALEPPARAGVVEHHAVGKPVAHPAQKRKRARSPRGRKDVE